MSSVLGGAHIKCVYGRILKPPHLVGTKCMQSKPIRPKNI